MMRYLSLYCWVCVLLLYVIMWLSLVCPCVCRGTLCGCGGCCDCDACTVVCVACVYAERLWGCECDGNVVWGMDEVWLW